MTDHQRDSDLSTSTRPESQDERALILVALAGGGWHRELYRIIERMPAERFRFAYAYSHYCGNHSVKRLPMPHAGRRYPLRSLGQTRQHPWRHVTNIGRFLAAFVESAILVRRLNPCAILGVAHSSAIPLLTAARLWGKRGVFIESITRISKLSRSGRIIYHLRLATDMYVQWPQLVTKYSRARFAGSSI
ncbi:MAG: hypothetical protein IID36_00430 [Planctomycetes bacterium]|nr:hypothetical protein [Planctomycetota bacterium]